MQSVQECKNLAASLEDFVHLPTFSGIRGNANNSTDLNFPTGLLPGSLFLYNNSSEVQTLLKQVTIKLMFSYKRKKKSISGFSVFRTHQRSDTSSPSKSPSRPSLPSTLDTDIKVEGCIRTRERSWEIHLQKCAAEWKAELQPVTNEAWTSCEGSKLRVGTRPLQFKLASHWSRLLFERDVPWKRKFPSQGQVPLKDTCGLSWECLHRSQDRI